MWPQCKSAFSGQYDQKNIFDDYKPFIMMCIGEQLSETTWYSQKQNKMLIGCSASEAMFEHRNTCWI